MSEQVSDILRGTGANLQVCRPLIGAVDHVVAVPARLRKGGGITRYKQRFATIFDEHQLTFEQEHELIFGRVPMPLARPLTWWQSSNIHSEVTKAAGVSQPFTKAVR